MFVQIVVVSVLIISTFTYSLEVHKNITENINKTENLNISTNQTDALLQDSDESFINITGKLNLLNRIKQNTTENEDDESGDEKIYGGVDVQITDYPYQAFMNTSRVLCGASIISPDWALTAAHCLKPGTSNVVLTAGTANRTSGGSKHQGIEFYIHENYTAEIVPDYDIALVKVTPPFPIGTPGVAAVKLATVDPSEGTVATVSGWGLTWGFSFRASETLKAIDVTIRPHQRCSFLLREYFTSRMVCASAWWKAACQGDSGGPLVNKSTGEQIGVVSFGFGIFTFCIRGAPDYYANVANLRDWIKQKTGV